MSEFEATGEVKKNEEIKKKAGYGRKAKRLVLSKIEKAKKKPQRKKRQKNRGLGFGCCCTCLYSRQRRIPSVDDLSSESSVSDPNCSEFGFDSLRSLIEKSDFLLNECNTHLDEYIGDDNDNDDG